MQLPLLSSFNEINLFALFTKYSEMHKTQPYLEFYILRGKQVRTMPMSIW